MHSLERKYVLSKGSFVWGLYQIMDRYAPFYIGIVPRLRNASVPIFIKIASYLRPVASNIKKNGTLNVVIPIVYRSKEQYHYDVVILFRGTVRYFSGCVPLV